jgi:hypothetical protein
MRLSGRWGLPSDSSVANKPTRNERIHEALRVHGYTLQEVGDIAGLHYSTVSRIGKKVAAATCGKWGNRKPESSTG